MSGTSRHPQAGQEGRPPFLTPGDDYVLSKVPDAITVGLPGRASVQYVPARAWLDACDQWEAWHRTAALINAWRHDPQAFTGEGERDWVALDRLLEQAGLTEAQGIAMAEQIEQARQGRLRVPPA